MQENNLCTYYNFENNPGIKAKGKFISSKFAYLEDAETIQKLISFSSVTQINVIFELPPMHCSSCIYLLEHLHKIDNGIISSVVNFQKKTVFISFNPEIISLRKVVELLAFIGYEPYLSLNDTREKKPVRYDKNKIIQIGVSGFCFSNIMMLSFPEYFSSGNISDASLENIFRWSIFILSLPVLIWGASSIFISAYKGLRQKDLNIDVPIAIAIIITFGRSYYEIISGTGSGYLDSGTGIIFYMLIGRWFQDKTYNALSFDRDYHSYFPLGVTVIKNGIESNIPATQLIKGDVVILRNEEMIPADSILLEGEAFLDYSFVSGENKPVSKKKGEILYAGGKQIGGLLQLQIIKEPSQSYITELWNNDAFSGKRKVSHSFIHPWSRYFTYVLFTIAISSSVYWHFNDPSLIFKVLTSVLIVACPCSLLLSATFTFGSMLRHFGKNKLYLRNSSVIEMLSEVDTIVFDKTGTITENNNVTLKFNGDLLTPEEQGLIKSATAQSSHHLSKMVSQSLPAENLELQTIGVFKEYAGEGIEAKFKESDILIGSACFTQNRTGADVLNGSRVYVKINGIDKGFYEIVNIYRKGFIDLINDLKKNKFQIHILSGDNNSEEERLINMLGKEVNLNFNVSPSEKLKYIESLQSKGKKVLMVGDGLNDAGALMQSDAGIAVSNNSARFTPACDAIIDGNVLQHLNNFINYAKSGKGLVRTGFILSIIYNIVGISFAVQGLLSPLVAAILMPASSISIVLTATLLSRTLAKRKHL